MLGGGQVETKATKAAEALLKRDFYPIFDLKSQVNFPSKSYFASVPSSFLSKSQVSQVLDTTNVSAFIETHGPDLSPKEKSKWETSQSFVKGDSIGSSPELSAFAASCRFRKVA